MGNSLETTTVGRVHMSDEEKETNGYLLYGKYLPYDVLLHILKFLPHKQLVSTLNFVALFKYQIKLQNYRRLPCVF